MLKQMRNLFLHKLTYKNNSNNNNNNNIKSIIVIKTKLYS